jgi:hypothetical protein
MEVAAALTMDAIALAIRAHELRANGFGIMADRQGAVAALLLDEICERCVVVAHPSPTVSRR